MILHAGNGCFLTQSAEVPMKERVFRGYVNINDAADIANWREVTGTEKDRMVGAASIIDLDDMDVASIKRVGNLVEGITSRINEVNMSVQESLELAAYFPKWEQGKLMPVGYKVSYEGSLYEVIQGHTSQADWTPNVTPSLFKVVQVEATGSFDDPIAWEQGMELFNGLYYTDNGVKYICNRDSGMGMVYDLANLVGLYVEVVE